jgi:hypothetical protein
MHGSNCKYRHEDPELPFTHPLLTRYGVVDMNANVLYYSSDALRIIQNAYKTAFITAGDNTKVKEQARRKDVVFTEIDKKVAEEAIIGIARKM